MRDGYGGKQEEKVHDVVLDHTAHANPNTLPLLFFEVLKDKVLEIAPSMCIGFRLKGNGRDI